MSGLRNNKQSCCVLASILFLALLHGGLYASFMPPWGLTDEEQHFHYIQHLAENGTPPIVGQTYLSPEIVNSVFDTHRRETFHWPALKSRDPREMGLEGHSYEGYQPPLFYMLLVPFYQALPLDTLVKLFSLRWIIVGLSLLSIWITYQTVQELFPRQSTLPYFVCLVLALTPERVGTTSQINNDILLEVISAALIWVCTKMMLGGLSIRGSQLMGLLFGLGIMVKMSIAPLGLLLLFVFWSQRSSTPNWGKCVLWAVGLLMALSTPLIIRNLYLYGDLTGFASFRSIAHFGGPRATWFNIVNAILDLFRHIWVIWWQGSEAGTNPILNGLYIVLAILSGLSLFNLGQFVWRHYQTKQRNQPLQVILMYTLGIGGYAIFILASYFGGQVPVIQGRFFLPVMGPLMILLCWGLWVGPRPQITIPILLLTLIISDILSLFGNLLPYFYYWSAFVKENAIQSYTQLEGWTAWTLFYSRFLSDKPPALYPVLVLLLPLYITVLLLTLTLVNKARSS